MSTCYDVLCIRFYLFIEKSMDGAQVPWALTAVAVAASVDKGVMMATLNLTTVVPGECSCSVCS